MKFILIDLNDYFFAAQSSYSSPSRLFCFWFVMEEMWFNYLVTCLLDLLCSAGLDAKQVIEGNCGLAGRQSFRPNHRYRSHLGFTFEESKCVGKLGHEVCGLNLLLLAALTCHCNNLSLLTTWHVLKVFVDKDFEDVPSGEEGEVVAVAGEGGQEEEVQSTDFMSKFANTLALFESEPKVRSIPVIGAKRLPPCQSTVALDDLLGIKSC